MSKKVCIIGSGASGLTAIKTCLDEGLEPVCYELDNDIGGLWRYDDGEKEKACVYKSTIINTSKEMMCYSDFPIPKDFANYMHNTKIIDYFRLYCKQFNLLNYIHFNMEVLSCKPAEDYKETGKWEITTKNLQTSDVRTVVFDGVLVCIGHHAIPHYPKDSFPGVDKFQGEIFHTHSYRNPQKYYDKKVVVIGIGNSGGDISVELGRHASQVYLSTRRGTWVLQRVSKKGIPLDVSHITRALSYAGILLPRLVSFFGEASVNEVFDHAKYGLKPKHRLFSQHPMVNDALPNSLLSGRVILKGNVVEFKEKGVVFEDGTYEDADVVVFATGFIYKFPFLDDSVVKVKNNECRLYKHVWPPNLDQSTLAIIGGVQPLGAVNPISELQCRWAARVFKGLNSLPSKQEMNKTIDERIENMRRRYYRSQRHTIQVDYVEYMDEVANMVGVKPDLWKWLKKDLKFGLKLIFGPCTPAQYRLDGPGKWGEAYNTIMTQEERMYCALATRKIAKEESNCGMWMIGFAVIILAFYLLW